MRNMKQLHTYLKEVIIIKNDNSKILLQLIKIQLLNMRENLDECELWINQNNLRLVEWKNKDISQNYSTIKGCLIRISKSIY